MSPGTLRSGNEEATCVPRRQTLQSAMVRIGGFPSGPCCSVCCPFLNCYRHYDFKSPDRAYVEKHQVWPYLHLPLTTQPPRLVHCLLGSRLAMILSVFRMVAVISWTDVEFKNPSKGAL